MNLEQDLNKRSGSQCELCKSTDSLTTYLVPPATVATIDDAILVCEACSDQLAHPDYVDANHWRCLNDSMWSTVPAVQIASYRMLYTLREEGWPQDLLDMMYLEPDVLKRAQDGLNDDEEVSPIHKDINGATLSNGDSVVIIKDLDVKGSSMTAKRGTSVRNISLVIDNHEQIEGKVNGQQIVILTKFIKKQ